MESNWVYRRYWLELEGCLTWRCLEQGMADLGNGRTEIGRPWTEGSSSIHISFMTSWGPGAHPMKRPAPYQHYLRTRGSRFPLGLLLGYSRITCLDSPPYSGEFNLPPRFHY